MNLNIEKLEPEPPSLTHPNLLALVLLPQPTLLLYTPPLPPDKPEQPKKKFAFKAAASPANTVEPVHLLDLSTRKWTTRQTKGKFPSRREQPAFACIGPCLMVYGGTQISPNKQLNDLYCLNLETWQWKKLFTMQAPPAHAHPIAVSHQDRLIIITNQIWIFNTKGVNWSAESTDLPGGVWQRVLGCELAFTPLRAFNQSGFIVVLGGQPKLAVASIDIQERKIQSLTINGQPHGQQKSIQVCSTSQGRGLVIDGHIFCSVIVHEQSVYIGQWTYTQDNIQRIVFTDSTIQTTNYGFNSKKQMILVELTLNKAEEEPQQQQQQNTARHIEREEEILRHSSILERQSYEERSSRPLPSPLSEGLNSPIVTRLSSLLAREWLRRRVLEEKGKLLQDTIKKAQKMVLALCRYGDEQEKQMHIARVCRIRQQLCKVLQSQSFIRKEMDERPGQKQLRSRALRQQQGLSCFDPNYL